MPPPPTIGLPPGNLQAPPIYPDAGLPAAPPPVITVPPTSAAAPTAMSVAPPPVPIAPPLTVDAQWAFPATTIAQSGYPLVLTTLVTRRSDRAPLAGWIVRYEVTSSDASLGSAGSNRVDVATDATGRASAEIRPMSTGGGQAVVNMAVLQPPVVGAVVASPMESSSLEVGRGSSTITWQNGVPGAPPPLAMMPSPTLLGPSSSSSTFPPPPAVEQPPPNRFEPPPSLSTDSSPPKTYGPPPKQEPAGKPELAVDVRRRGPENVSVGGVASFEVLVTNRGGSTARNIKVLDRFDAGLTHPKAVDSELAVKYEAMRDLAPGESATVPLTFGVQAAGQLCHHVTVSADDAASVSGSGCVTAIDAKPQTPPTIEVTKQGPTRHYVGELAKFRVVIKNTGEVPVTNLEVIDSYDEAFDPRFTDPGREILPDGSFQWRIARLEMGEKREFVVQCACVTPSRSACSRVIVTADGDVRVAENKCVEILPLATPPPNAPGAVTPPPALSAANLKLSLRSTANPARVGVAMTLFVFVENAGQQLERGVSLRVLVPQETTPDATLIRPSGTFQIVGQREIRFDDLGELQPGQRRQIEIPLRVDRPGVVTFWSELNAAGLSKPINTESDPIQIEAAAQ
jgi:uncharacterized repeat protein (TIGR01451 family)